MEAAIWALGQIGDVRGIVPIINLLSYKTIALEIAT